MSSSQEKVKDLVEVRKFESLRDFHTDPSATVGAYQFTDITAGLMSGWLDAVGRAGTASGHRALAGFRGVGKSHFMAAFGALLARPELRQAVTDPHVALSADSLLRRRYPVAYVHRGTRESLFEELRAAIGAAFGLPAGSAPRNLPELMNYAVGAAGDMPFVILIDTAYDRPSRVDRDDGQFLGELAAAAIDQNVFIAVALDDDITEADGINAAIVRQYAIDFLDQEHLYRIADTHIFPKNRAKSAVIDEVYAYFRKVLPDFRWSQERFRSLYPLHPLILEIAPVIRLHAPDFALLSFASEAGDRILGRPARSLIGLDEVFDCVESTLRDDPGLGDAFELYDQISSEIPSMVPVFQRLQAKLILKALFVLSMEGDGTTAGELSASILVYDEQDPDSAVEDVATLIESFMDAFPESFWRVQSGDSEIRYSLRVSGKDNLNHALAEAAAKAGDQAIPGILKRIGKERFGDWPIDPANGKETVDWADVGAEWRGALKDIRVFWNWENEEESALETLAGAAPYDLEVLICGPGETGRKPGASGIRHLRWNAAPLAPDEEETLLRYSVLLRDEELRTEFSDQIAAAAHTLSVAAAKIWKRVFFTDSRWTSGSEELEFESPQDEQNFAALISSAVGQVLDRSFPNHPVFTETLGMKEVSVIVSDLFSGARVGDERVQNLAALFAHPLGLVTEKGDTLVLEKEERLFELHLVEKVLTLVARDDAGTIPLGTVSGKLHEYPYGLSKEAQFLILAALVASGKIEFVTTGGDRINRRSLDLSIIWADIIGISKPKDVLFGSNRLTDWARLIAGNEDLRSIDIADDRKNAKSALLAWLDGWREERIIERFEEIPSDRLNTGIWSVYINAEKTFGVVADALEGLHGDKLSLEEALQQVAVAFTDSEEVFRARSRDLMSVAGFVEEARIRASAETYLASAEITDDEEVERLRQEVRELLDAKHDSCSAAGESKLGSAFDRFRDAFSGHFALEHERAADRTDIRKKVDEVISSDEWWEFETLAKLPVLGKNRFEDARRLVNRLRKRGCGEAAASSIRSRPFCGCSFRLSDPRDSESVVKDLISLVLNSTDSYKRTLSTLSELLEPILLELASESVEQREAAEAAILKIIGGGDAEMFTTDEMHILREACERLSTSIIVTANVPRMGDFVTAKELAERLDGWIRELPGEPVRLNTE